ncbi:hypothetical protein AG1IA_08979 [Rhizoctonia solani AG-1 IA]|uniref:Uncharacterized protein n=1 Tax=Thanatephorus cucumeris (strain AG1-IA) TaxID=983506 RepID=L8WJK1_THACA|nr:hypothetical protein AG1IA_08979 [Rhizoctonia solani AG-1 IA]
MDETWLNTPIGKRNWSHNPGVTSNDMAQSTKHLTRSRPGTNSCAPVLHNNILPTPSSDMSVPVFEMESRPVSKLLSLYYPTVSPYEPVQNATRVAFGGPAHLQAINSTTGRVSRIYVPMFMSPGDVSYACKWCFQLKSYWRSESACPNQSTGVSNPYLISPGRGRRLN